MAYTKQTWTDDVSAVTGARMTHIEDGIYDNSLATDKINPSGTATTTAEIEEGQIADAIGFKSLKLKGQTSQYTTTGKNIFPRITFSQTINGVTITATGDGTIKIKGTANSSGVNHPIWGAWGSSTTLFTIPAGTYTASGIGTRQSSPRMNIVTNGTTSIFVTNTTQTLDSDTNVTGIFIWVDAGTTVDTTFKPMIETGSSATSYEPYTGEKASPNPDFPQDVNNVSGDNVITISNVNLSEKWETGDINAYTGIESANTSVLRNTNYIHYDTSLTYRLSVNGAKPNNSVSLRFYNKNKEYIGYAQLNIGGGSNFSITVSTSVSDTTPKYFRIRMATTVATISDNIMLTTKSDLSYTEHQGNDFEINLGDIEICKIGTAQDYIYRKNGKWYIYKAIRKAVLDGTINYAANKSSTTNNALYVTNNISNMKPVANNGILGNIMSTHFKTYTTDQIYSGTAQIGIGKRDGSGISIGFGRDTELTTKELVNAWLAEAKPAIYYEVLTPTIEEITDTILLRQLDELYNSGLYDVTNISQDNSSEAFILDLEACKNNINGIIEYIRR